MFDFQKLRLASLLAAILVALCLGWLFMSSEREVVGLQVEPGDGVPAGPLSDGVTLEQAIDIPEGLNPDGFLLGIKFGTYSRNNFGKILIQLVQGDTRREHTVRSSRLRDNRIEYFAFPGFQADNARLILQGLDGSDHNSATVWCRYSSERSPMLLNGEPTDRRVDVWFAHKTESREVILNRVGVGGLIFLTLVMFGVLTTLFYRGFVELEFLKALKSDVAWLDRMVKLRRLMISIPASLVAGGLVALIFFLLSDKPVNYLSVNDSYSEERVPIDPLIEGALVEQAFEVTPEMAGNEIGLGLRFGTYLRKNSAKVDIRVSQGDASDSVTLNSKTIEDGQERIFIFKPFEPGEAILTISGINGTGSNSPTVWFEPSQEEPLAQVNGEKVPQRLILYRYRVVSEGRGYTVGGNRFPYKWVGAAMLIVFVWMQVRGPKKKSVG